MLPSSAKNMLARNLFYTAITRAKKEVIIVAQTGAVDLAIDNVNNQSRRTNLKEKIQWRIK